MSGLHDWLHFRLSVVVAIKGYFLSTEVLVTVCVHMLSVCVEHVTAVLLTCFGLTLRHLDDPLPVLDALINPRVTNLPGHIQAIFVQNIIKLYASIIVKAEAEVKKWLMICN